MKNNNMKIGIITFHCSYNYGSALQAYALQQYLVKRKFKVKIIDFVMLGDFEQYRLFRTKVYKKNIKALLVDMVCLKKNIRRKDSFTRFKRKYLDTTSKTYYDSMQMSELNREFDLFICGSDQIWNFDCTKGIEPAYFLEFVDLEKLKIAYAPSLAHTYFKELDTNYLKRLLERFDYLSVREKSTIPLIQGLVNQEVKNTLDPTLLLDERKYKEIIKPYKTNGEFIFFYVLEPNEKMVMYCNEISKKQGLKVVFISKRPILGLKKSKNVYGIEPGEFLSLIQQAKYIITNSFHATVFSVIFKKQFATFGTKKSSSRMVDLLSELNLKNRIVEDEFDIANAIDYEKVHNKLDKLREKSIDFLTQALGEKGLEEQNE